VETYSGQNAQTISDSIFMLFHLSSQMRQRRYKNGSLSLHSVKLIFELDERGEPVSVSQFESKEANNMIEEFMLLANISVAQKIASKYIDEALLRKHEEPLERRLVS
jgi:protein SSD1